MKNDTSQIAPTPAPKPKPKPKRKPKIHVFRFVIDQDDGDRFMAHVENIKGQAVFSYSNIETVEDGEDGVLCETTGPIWLVTEGWMAHPRDVNGLHDYLLANRLVPRRSGMNYVQPENLLPGSFQPRPMLALPAPRP